MSSLVEKIADAVTPAPSAEDRAKAREKARATASPGDWLSTIVDQHVELESAFQEVKSAMSEDGREKARKRLAVLLMGHSIAEEAVLYPAMAEEGEKGDAKHAYSEQVTTKIQMAKLAGLQPLSQEYLDKLEEIRKAVLHHMYSEEGSWFPELHKDAAAEQAKLTRRYKEEYDRYVGGDVKGF